MSQLRCVRYGQSICVPIESTEGYNESDAHQFEQALRDCAVALMNELEANVEVICSPEMVNAVKRERVDFEFNMNDRVKVKLKQEGIDILKQQHKELDEWIRSRNGKGLRPFTIEVDDEGYSTFQMWDLMNKFGEHMTMIAEPPFHLNIIVCGGERTVRG